MEKGNHKNKNNLNKRGNSSIYNSYKKKLEKYINFHKKSYFNHIMKKKENTNKTYKKSKSFSPKNRNIPFKSK